MLKFNNAVLSLSIIGLLILSLAFAFAQDEKKDDQSNKSIEKVQKLMDESGYRYTKADKNLWSTTFEGKNKKEIIILISCYSDRITICHYVADYEELDISREFLEELLKINAEYSYGRFALDKDGLFLIYDVATRILDLQELVDDVELIASLIDKQYPRISKFIKKK